MFSLEVLKIINSFPKTKETKVDGPRYTTKVEDPKPRRKSNFISANAILLKDDKFGPLNPQLQFTLFIEVSVN